MVILLSIRVEGSKTIRNGSPARLSVPLWSRMAAAANGTNAARLPEVQESKLGHAETREQQEEQKMNSNESATARHFEPDRPKPEALLNPLVPVNVASVKHRSPFRYPGGKTWLVPHVRRWLRSFSLPIERFVEPFAGGAIVGLSALLDHFTRNLTLIEKDLDVASVWQTIASGGATDLARRITSFDLTEKNVHGLFSNEYPVHDIESRAFVTIVRNRVQRGGIIAPGAGIMRTGENGKGIRSRWYPQTLHNRLLDLHPYHAQIDFHAGDGLDYMRLHADEAELFWFIDPPYTVAGRRLYTHSEINHEDLFRVASKLKGRFLMTYDDTPEITLLARNYDFEVETVAMKNTHHSIMKELLISRDLNWFR